jgi:hypothetical protein
MVATTTTQCDDHEYKIFSFILVFLVVVVVLVFQFIQVGKKLLFHTLFFVPRLFYSRFKLSLAENLKKSLFFIHTRLQPEKSCRAKQKKPNFHNCIAGCKKKKARKNSGKIEFSARH